MLFLQRELKFVGIPTKVLTPPPHNLANIRALEDVSATKAPIGKRETIMPLYQLWNSDFPLIYKLVNNKYTGLITKYNIVGLKCVIEV